eukprot:s2656_g4.t1
MEIFALHSWPRWAIRREVALIPRPIWDLAMADVRIGPGPPLPANPPTPVEAARLESMRRVCLLRMGRIPDLPGDIGPQAPAPLAAPFPPAGGGAAGATASGSRKLKLSSILDPTLDAEIQSLPENEIAAMYERYKTRFGDFPTSEADVSKDQLSALSQVLAASAVPFADFSVFGPHGQRLLRRQTFMAYQLNVSTGEWSRKEQPGPADFHSWYRCWKCFRTAMLLLEAAEAERLDSYSEFIRAQVTQFGDDAWSFVSRADNRMRAEHLDRLRRQLRSEPQYGFTEASPWSACFAAATRESDFWSRELHTPATLFLARNKREGGTEPSEETTKPAGSPNKRPKTRASRRYTGEDKSRKGSDGKYELNRKGIEICRLYNAGKCGGQSAAGVPAAAKPDSKDSQGKKRPVSPAASPTKKQKEQIIGKRKLTAVKSAAKPGSSSTQAAPKPGDTRPPLKRRRTTQVEKEPASSSGSKPVPAPDFGKVVQLEDPPRDYGYWQSREGPLDSKAPKALIIFSGRSREGDLSHCLAKLGWVVCAIDTIAPKPTDILDDAVWELITDDIQDFFFDALWVATPCGSFSPLRERPPGPRPLRSVQHIEGLPSAQLTQSEQKQVKEANILVKRSYTAAAYQNKCKKPWGLENPKHPDDKPQLWMMPLIVKLAEVRDVIKVDFDQCRTGLSTTKPTRLLVKRIDLSELAGLRCNHEKTERTRSDGSKYMAAHDNTVQKWVEGPSGRQRASKSQGEYTEELCTIIARAFHATTDKEWRQRELHQEPL